MSGLLACFRISVLLLLFMLISFLYRPLPTGSKLYEQ